jgi:hypothetical protein
MLLPYRYLPHVTAGVIEELITSYGVDGRDKRLDLKVNGEWLQAPGDLLARDSSGMRGKGDYLLRWPTGCLTVVAKEVFERGFERVDFSGDGLNVTDDELLRIRNRAAENADGQTKIWGKMLVLLMDHIREERAKVKTGTVYAGEYETGSALAHKQSVMGE